MTLPPIHPAAADGFASNAIDYERTRPGYPVAAAANLRAVLGLEPGVTVVDVAAGTGKLTRLLLPTGARVIAVEPVGAMRDVLAGTCPGAEVLEGTAEHLPFPDGSVDAITVAQAFHWFDGPRALGEFARVLRRRGALAVVYNHRDRDAAWLAAVNRLVEVHRRDTPQQWDGRWRAAFDRDRLFTPLEEVSFDNPQTLGPEEFVGRIRSMSYVGALPAGASAHRDRRPARRPSRHRRSGRDRHRPADRRVLVPPALMAGVASRPAALAAMREALLGWSTTGWRELPWRRTRDPWAVLVSELMLQQTQVSRVVPKWESFVSRWPTAPSCAADPSSEVVRAWAGLGYNRRALNLHRSAVTVTTLHGGQLPGDLTALEALPGIGPYTARAVLAFAFERDLGVVDTNAARVIARAAAGATLTRPALQAVADSLVPPGAAWAWNQAVLDLGATVCTARRPRCGVCPLARACAWLRNGGPDPAARSAAAPRFEGSDRQARGRLLDALRAGPVSDVPAACGMAGDVDRAARIAAGLVADGFAGWDSDVLALASGAVTSVTDGLSPAGAWVT